jgi:hypothetical protein
MKAILTINSTIIESAKYLLSVYPQEFLNSDSKPIQVFINREEAKSLFRRNSVSYLPNYRNRVSRSFTIHFFKN